MSSKIHRWITLHNCYVQYQLVLLLVPLIFELLFRLHVCCQLFFCHVDCEGFAAIECRASEQPILFHEFCDLCTGLIQSGVHEHLQTI
jgi:hypothetical protein